MTTRWSVVMEAQGDSPSADAALEQLCRTYWRPLYGFVRRQSASHEEAQDLTQAFFARLIERRDLNVVRQEKGRLRSYLLVSLKNFLTNERHRASAFKRGEGRRILSLDEMRDCEHGNYEPADPVSAEQLYERAWANTLLQRALERLKQEYDAAGNAGLFAQLQLLLVDDGERPSQAEIAAHLKMNENALKQAFHRFRQRYRQVLREEVAHTLATPGDVEDEMRHLIHVLRT